MKLTAPQRLALISARDHGDPTWHLRGRSDHGGWARTYAALKRRGLLDHHYQITDIGRAQSLGGRLAGSLPMRRD